MQEALVLIITLAAVVYGIVRIKRMFSGRRECECDRCPAADCAGRDANGSPVCPDEESH
jgi:hypothetical protein